MVTQSADDREAMNPAVGCRCFPPGPRLPSQRPLVGTKLYCLATQARVRERLAQGCYTKARGGRESNLRPVDRKSSALTTTPPESDLVISDIVQKSSDGNAYFVKVHCPWDVLEKGAALLKLRKKIKLDEVTMLRYCVASLHFSLSHSVLVMINFSNLTVCDKLLVHI